MKWLEKDLGLLGGDPSVGLGVLFQVGFSEGSSEQRTER